MKRIPKTIAEHIVQGHYGGGHGWEDLVSESTPKEARQQLREYRENEPQYPHRLIKRRVPNPEYSPPTSPAIDQLESSRLPPNSPERADSIGREYDLICDSGELANILDYLGIPPHNRQGVTAAFVKIDNGEYRDVWLTEASRYYAVNAQYRPAQYYF